MAQPTPLPRREFTNKLVDPYLKSEGKPILPGSQNRGDQVSLKNDTTKQLKINLEDLDGAVQYYFENVIKPYVIQNGQRIAVPVVIASPEKFKSVQTDGFYRDKNGKIMCPLITFNRKTVTKNRDLGNKLDGNVVNNIQVFEQKYSKRNIYDNFGVLQNTKPQVARRVTIVPDYVTVVYECIIFTNFIEENNRIVEATQFASDSYWGDLTKFSFRSYIDTFNTTTLLEQETDRAAKSTFTLTLNGYLVPDTINKDLAIAQNKLYDKTKITFTAETVSKLPK